MYRTHFCILQRGYLYHKMAASTLFLLLNYKMAVSHGSKVDRGYSFIDLIELW